MDDLSLFPYKIQVLQKQSKNNKKQRRDYAKRISQMIEDGILDIRKIHWSDEVNFHLSGHVNKQNMRFWALEQPEPDSNKPLSREKVIVWCAIASNRVIGPYFFENRDGESITVNSDRYLNMLKKFYLPALRRHNEVDDIIFQQDGAPPHYALVVRSWLEEKFGDRVISRGFDNFWPPYSPDLNPCDFIFGGTLSLKYIQILFLRLVSNLRRTYEEK